MWFLLAAPNEAAAVCPTPAPDRTVCASGCTDTSIAAAVAAAGAGNVICVSAGTWAEHFEVGFGADLTVEGDGGAVLQADGTAFPVVHTWGGALVVRNLVIDGSGIAQCAKAEETGASLTLEQVTLTGCAGSYGAAIEAGTGTDLALTGSTVRQSVSTGNGVVAVAGSLVADGVTVETNVAGGGVLLVSGRGVVVRNSVFRSNRASTDQGGAIWATGTADLTLEGVAFDDNTASTDGGAVSFGASGRLVVTGSTFTNDRALGRGGGLFVGSGQGAALTDVVFDDDTAGEGGGLYADATVDLVRPTFRGNDATRSAGAARLASGSIRNGWFQGNHAGVDGGGLYAANAVAVDQSTFVENTAVGSGDAVEVGSAGSVTFANNLVAWHAGVAVDAAGVWSSAYDGWYANGADLAGGAFGVGEILGQDPGFVSFTADGVENDDLRLAPGSPMIDAGDPATTDPDGSRADLGCFGGLDAADFDADGWAAPIDCDDVEASVHPGAPEVVDDGVDQDCDGLDLVTCYGDRDGDGVGVAPVGEAPICPLGSSPRAGDCDDADPDTFPGAREEAGDGVDSDCDGDHDEDDDGLTWEQEALLGTSDGDPDTDGDLLRDDVESAWPDADADGVPNALDADSDDDGVPDAEEGAEDRDADGLPNFVDPDDGDGPAGDPDRDGIPNEVESAICVRGACLDPLDPDTDGDLVSDGLELHDTDGDGAPDWLDLDDDGDGVSTAEETGFACPAGEAPLLVAADDGLGLDCGGVLLAVPAFRDSDGDGLPDYLDADPGPPGGPGDTDDPAAGSVASRLFFCGCATARPGPAWLVALPWLARRRRPRQGARTSTASAS